MRRFIKIVMFLICMNTLAAQEPDDISETLNTVASELGFRGRVVYNTDNGNIFVMPSEGYDLPLDRFCMKISTDYPWIFIKFIFKADPQGDHTAYECQRPIDIPNDGYIFREAPI